MVRKPIIATTWILGVTLVLVTVPFCYICKGFQMAHYCDDHGIRLLINADIGGGGMQVSASDRCLQKGIPMDTALAKGLASGQFPAGTPFDLSDLEGFFVGIGTHLYYHEPVTPRIR